MTASPGIRVGVLISADDEILMERLRLDDRGDWDLPSLALMEGETLAEAVVRVMDVVCQIQEGVCGPFIGWQESFGVSAGPHWVYMVFRGVELTTTGALAQEQATGEQLSESEAQPSPPPETRWVSAYDLPDLRTRDGLVEFLSDQAIIDTVA